MTFFAEIFSKYWFVLCLAVLVAGTMSTATVSSRRRGVARIVAVAASVMILLGVIGLLLG